MIRTISHDNIAMCVAATPDGRLVYLPGGVVDSIDKIEVAPGAILQTFIPVGRALDVH